MHKRSRTDLLHALGDGDVFQLKTHFKRLLRNHLQRGRNGNTFQNFTVCEHTHAHLGQTFRQNDLFHTGDRAESIITDALQFGRQFDAFKRVSGIVVVNVFATKGCFTDVGDTVIQFNTRIGTFRPRGRVFYHVTLVIRYTVTLVIVNDTIVIHGAFAFDVQRLVLDAPCEIGAAQVIHIADADKTFAIITGRADPAVGIADHVVLHRPVLQIDDHGM